VVVVDVHSPSIPLRCTADGAFPLLELQQQVDELLRHAVVPQTDPLRIAWLAVRPWRTRRIERRVVGELFVFAAPEALDNAGPDHVLDGPVTPSLP
jgi:hypothetical protein